MASPSLSSGFQTPLPPTMPTPSPVSSQLNHHHLHQNNNQNTSGSSLFDTINDTNNLDGNENDSSKKLQTFKARRKNYRLEKKKLTAELISAIQDPTTIVMSDWLKVRTTLKQWNKYYCELRPGSLYMFKNQKTYKPSNWVGTVMLKMCEVLERPSKKGGFCFKLFHPLDHPIWAPKGPHGEEFTSLLFPLPVSSAIFRAPSEEAGRKWMEAIELSLNCTDLIAPRHIVSSNINANINTIVDNVNQRRDSMPMSPLSTSVISTNSAPTSQTTQSLNYINSVDDDLLMCNNNINEIDIETHFDIDDDGHTDHGEHDDSIGQHTTEESDDSIFLDDDFNLADVNSTNTGDHHKSIKQSLSNDHSLKTHNDIPEVAETNYAYDGGNEEFGLVGDAGQTEDVPEENKSLLWTLLKQVRPGMDLSKVVLPTFILEPRSFLEKLTDYYYHCDIISNAALEDDPLMRMKLILKWYLSGFYKKPKGLKKPYNPILGETFRCYWHHPETDSRTFYIAEQVSHHPPVSAFYVTNRKDGFCISGSILAKSKFYGNSISALLEGTARLTLLARGEDYLITFPFAHCKGIFLGPLAFELGGKVTITCEKTGYKSELEFKLKPFFGSDDQCNLLIGKVRLGNETMASIEGHWDSEIFYKDKRKGESELFWSGIDPKVKSNRLKRFIVPLDEQLDNESEKLWHKVTLAIQKQDQNMATVEKTNLEEAQRDAARQRSSRLELWEPKFFILDNKINDWLYRMAEVRPWDNRTDVKQYEQNYVILTLTRHLNPNFIARSSNKTNEQMTDMNTNVNVHKHRRFRRQHTCADPTSIDINATNKMDSIPSALDSPQLLGTSSSNRFLTRNFDTMIQRLSKLQDSVERMKEEQSVLRTEFQNLRSAVTISNQLSRSSRDIKTLHNNSSNDGTFAITKMQIHLLFKSIPSEIRLVIIVLVAHFIFNYLFH
ncbi:oxysterol-binding protein-related protein 8 isoform X4 [Dermatophagoides farinae]|nr:oxysterol-binding protein-related protein 8-like [Dermatophagoides farinae]KAH7645527.1 oxysterol-binding protein-related-like protein [Dermatophagoides farinae]